MNYHRIGTVAAAFALISTAAAAQQQGCRLPDGDVDRDCIARRLTEMLYPDEIRAQRERDRRNYRGSPGADLCPPPYKMTAHDGCQLPTR
jgi:hypothetical protein